MIPDAPQDHADHGRGTVDAGPDDPDCPCRGGVLQLACAVAGCGFCSVPKAPPCDKCERQATALDQEDGDPTPRCEDHRV